MAAMTGAADTDLPLAFASAIAGDDVAFARIVARYHEELLGIAVVVCRDRTLAEEAVQATWAIAWRKLSTVRDPTRLRPWLVSVAVNEAKQLFRRRRRHTTVAYVADLAGATGGPDPATGVAGVDLRLALERLDADDRALLALRYVAGFDSTELAGVVGLTPAGVRTRLKRLLDGLRRELG
jgi:DNA-directed RNA polymerase specialized sigma24 family protein